MASFLTHQFDDLQDVPILLSSNTNTASFDDYLATDSFENRNTAVADITIWPTHVLHAPQPQHPIVDTMSTSYSSVGNEAIGLSISRPPAPIFNYPQPHHTLCYDNTICPRSSHIDRPNINELHSTHPCCWDNEGTPCNHELQVISKDILAHFLQRHRIDVDSEGSFACSWIHLTLAIAERS
ncbi:hypothetical protein BDR07DRAFT_760265 [Suillus spraguei]|nr:hypothetical protein BDR07DRAFT_760265 [Suillus spraguei]